MKKGLRQNRCIYAASSSAFCYCPDEEGIETRDAEVLFSHPEFCYCPDEEGIETRRRQASGRSMRPFCYCPDEEGIETRHDGGSPGGHFRFVIALMKKGLRPIGYADKLSMTVLLLP